MKSVDGLINAYLIFRNVMEGGGRSAFLSDCAQIGVLCSFYGKHVPYIRNLTYKATKQEELTDELLLPWYP